MQCVILAGGLATRMRPLTETLPKAMLEVAGRPFADWQLRWVAAQGVTDVVYCVAHLAAPLRAFVGDGAAWGVRVAWSDEGEQLLGTAGAVRRAATAGLLDERFAVLYGDSYLDVSVGAVDAAHRAAGTPMLMTVYRNDGRYDRSNVRYEGGRVLRYDKDEPDPVTAGMHHIDYGLMVLRRDAVLAEVPPGRRWDLAEVQHRLAARGDVAGFEVTERFYEIGSPQGLADLAAHLRA